VRIESHDPYAALRLPDFRLFNLGRNVSGLGDAMQSVVIGWELYQRTGKALTLGYVGLIQALPIFLFALHAGHVADRFARKRIVLTTQTALCLCSLTLAILSITHAAIPLFFLCLFCAGTARAFGNPARSALLPQIVPVELLSSAISWDTSIRRIAVMLGAALGGWLLAWSHRAAVVYLVTATTSFLSVLFLARLAVAFQTRPTGERATLKVLAAGLHYVWQSKIILATLTLDLFAVLLGGATTLLPVYARDILHAGPEGLGWLRAAPSAGALVMALSLAHLPPFRYAGRAMLWAVAGFGVATIVFGLSRSLPLSLIALFLTGALDMISVVVRQTLVQTLTPNAMRGRVNAVNGVFISSSNELGGFESGLVAQWFTPVISVVSGGIGTIAVVLAAAVIWPAIRAFRTPEAEGSRQKAEGRKQ
jgi:MFS family permease